MLGRDVRAPGDERLVVDLDGHDLEAHSLGVGEAQASPLSLDLDPLCGQPLRPERNRLFRPDAPDDRVHHPGTRTPSRQAGILEEGEVGARAPELVRVEQVVDGRIVLVDRLLDEP
jgi:hypothetical protein